MSPWSQLTLTRRPVCTYSLADQPSPGLGSVSTEPGMSAFGLPVALAGWLASLVVVLLVTLVGDGNGRGSSP